MKRKLVESSSTIKSVGFDEWLGLLEVEFKGKKKSVYQYKGVSAEVHEKWLKESYGGKYFHANIRNAGFEYRKIEEDDE